MLTDLLPGLAVLLAIAAIVRLTRPTTDYVDRQSPWLDRFEQSESNHWNRS